MRLGLVLGGGGLVGLGYHAGVLKALDEAGIDITDPDIIVGTSAGSIIGSYLAAGWSQTDFYEYAHGRHANSVVGEDDQKDEIARIFTPAWQSPTDRVRRGIGGIFALAASRGYWNKATGGREPHHALKKLFPSGMYSTDETRQRLHDDLPEEWPRDGLYVCAVDLFSGERVPFGHPAAPPAPLPEAVLASTAIPGVFPAIHIGDRYYVDGGAASATSLDLASDAGCDAIICVAPLGYKNDAVATPRDPKMWGPVMVRALFARSLRREVLAARAKGIDVFVIRPWLTDLKSHGTNSMRHYDRAAFTDATVEGTLRLLQENEKHPVLEAFRSRATNKKAG
ncbi:MAG TPA: patatin-like phospholipase family protein [Actinomycetota bacterium]|nr:patatin-like phospholipase family protein [Actinomycetota bacterium]